MSLIADVNKKTISDAVSIIKEYFELSTASAKTRQKYDITANRLIKKAVDSGQSVIAVALETSKEKTWFVRRSALKHATIKKLVACLDAYYSKKSHDPHWINLIQTKLDHHINGYHLLNNTTFTATEDSHSKKDDLTDLNREWMEEVCSNADDEYFLPMLVMANTGCRPGELDKGVKVYSADQYLHFEIQGLKTKEEAKVKSINTNEIIEYPTGQNIRVLSIPLVTEEVNCHRLLIDSLPQLIDEYPYTTMIKIKSIKNFASAVTAIGKKLYPERKSNITPIMFRHQVASNLKASRLPKEKIAELLGHRSMTTQQKYGAKKNARGYFKPHYIKATHPITAKHKKVPKPKVSLS